MLAEAPDVPDVIEATLIELASDKVLNRAWSLLAMFFKDIDKTLSSFEISFGCVGST